jgi:hypothetical protein
MFMGRKRKGRLGKLEYRGGEGKERRRREEGDEGGERRGWRV